MEFLQHFLPSKAVEENGHWSVGALTSFATELEGGHSVIFGLDLEATKGWLSEVQSLPGFGTFPQGVHYDYEIDARVAAPFVHSDWQLTDDLSLTAGLRLEWTEYDYDTDAPAGVNGRYVVPEDRSDTFQSLTPKLGLVWQTGPSTALYTNYARGARAPQTTDVYRLQGAQVVGEIEEEELDSLDVGVRHFGERLSLSLAAFAMEKRNFLLPRC